MTLYEGDFQFLQSMYPDLGGSAVVRELVANHRAKLEAALPQPEPSDPGLIREVLLDLE